MDLIGINQNHNQTFKFVDARVRLHNLYSQKLKCITISHQARGLHIVSW